MGNRKIEKITKAIREHVKNGDPEMVCGDSRIKN